MPVSDARSRRIMSAAGFCLAVVIFFSGGAAFAERIIPTPKYLEPIPQSVVVVRGGSVDFMVGPEVAAKEEKLDLAWDFIKRDLTQADASIHTKAEGMAALKQAGAHICLWDYSVDQSPPLPLNLLDRATLTDPGHYGQSYVIRFVGRDSVWVVGSTGQGTLLGAMSLLQLIHKTSGGTEISGAYIRDYPDFQYRAGANWLLNGESSRWALERGQGIEAYKRLCERKLDEALRFKINMVFFDGFGWGLKQRFSAYADMMRSLNLYARARGIRLEYGGYGASYGITYQTGPLYEAQSYLGEVWKNRESYPDGPTYECMGFPGAKKGVNPRILGSCRANDDLNGLKGEELRKFVEAVEPGALYIHHEDFGSINRTQAAWQQRCARCRKRWPNDSLDAVDGGAGGLAHGYSALIQAVNSVKNPADGYDASRDCLIILVSPVYYADSRSADDWSHVLSLWKLIAAQLPPAKNVEVCFREIFPEEYGGGTWVNAFNSVMRNAGLPLTSFIFFLGGANSYSTNNPLSGHPALNAVFQGAQGIYNFCGDFYDGPQEVINAEYNWNTRSSGFFRDPGHYSDAVKLSHQYESDEGLPPEIFGPGGIYEAACNILYGPRAGPLMAAFYRESGGVPEALAGNGQQRERSSSIRSSYLPMMWDRSYAVPILWRDLAIDAETWATEITNERYVQLMARLKLSPAEVQSRLVQYWTVLADLNTRGSNDIKEALQAELRPNCREDLEFLQNSFQVDRPLIQALADFHAGMTKRMASPPQWEGAKADFEKSLGEAQRAHELAVKTFGQPIDPAGGEVGALRTYSERLVHTIEQTLSNRP